MMALLRRANDEQASEWQPVPEGVWRWVIDRPEVKLSERFGNYQVRFPLALTPDEMERLIDEHGKPPEGTQQSYRCSYTTGLSLGYTQRDGQYKSTKLIDFLSAAVGQANVKRFRDWVAAGGGPPKAEDPDDQQQELDQIQHWLEWFQGLEVYGSVRHEEDKQQANVWWARFAGPMAVGSLPGQREDDYQAVGRGKLRSMIAEYDASVGKKISAAVVTRMSDVKVTDELGTKNLSAEKRREHARKVLTEDIEDDEQKDIPF